MSTPSIYGEYAQYLPKILQEITDPIIAANITSVSLSVVRMN